MLAQNAARQAVAKAEEVGKEFVDEPIGSTKKYGGQAADFAWGISKSIWNSAAECADSPKKCAQDVKNDFKDLGASIGTGTGSFVMGDLNNLYGQDVRSAQGALVGMKLVEGGLTAVGAGKVLGTGSKILYGGAKEAAEKVKDLRRLLDNDPAKQPHVTASPTGNIKGSIVSADGKLIDVPKDVLDKQQALIAAQTGKAAGDLREEISDAYFKGSGYTKLDGKCGQQCFDGVYIKNGEIYIVEVKPLQPNGSIKLSPESKSTGLPGQMDDKWIADRAKYLAERGSNLEAKETGELIIKAIDDKKPINKIVVGISDSHAVILNLGNKVEIVP